MPNFTIPSSLVTRRALAPDVWPSLMLAATLAACASSAPIVVEAIPTPADSVLTSSGSGVPPARAGSGWQIDTREHVDLWLHGFALLQDDESLVPYFRPGYRATMSGMRAATGQLDVNRERLQRRVTENPNLISAQFLALYFLTWDDMRRGVERFLAVQGEVRAARSQEELRMFATLRTYFSTAEDREWLRLFMNALQDERSRFYRTYWLQQQQQRATMRHQVESMWTATYRAAFSRFMSNSMQRDGRILLSLPIGGEGRTLAVGARDNFVTVTFPQAGGDPREALFVVAHEVVGGVATAAVRDNSSAADQRSGDAARWTTLAAVRGGAMLLQRVAPDLLPGYQRYYLSLAKVTASDADAPTKFLATFPLPETIATALERQVDVVLGGI